MIINNKTNLIINKDKVIKNINLVTNPPIGSGSDIPSEYYIRWGMDGYGNIISL